jgi:hypothetical protein
MELREELQETGTDKKTNPPCMTKGSIMRGSSKKVTPSVKKWKLLFMASLT